MNNITSLIKYTELNQATLPQKGYRGLNLFGKIKFTSILLIAYIKVYLFHFNAVRKKECYIGPFVGEFGNFLLHILPYLSYLNSKGVKINYCGLEIHKPFLVDESGNSLLNKFYSVPDYFKNVKPSGNAVFNLPEEINSLIESFKLDALNRKFPFLNLSDLDLYWYVFRNWQLNNRQLVYDLSKVYNPDGIRKNQVIIFPRKMKEYTPNNGGAIDFIEVANTLLTKFDKVIFVGHPEFVKIDQNVDNSRIEFCFDKGNLGVLKFSSSSSLIVTPHSGAMHVGGYTNTPVLMLFYGKSPVKGLDDTIRFRENFKCNKVDVVFSEEELTEYLLKGNHE